MTEQLGSGGAVGTADSLRDALQGVVCVVVAPFRDGTAAVDEERCTALVARIAAGGVHAVTALGNTAEVFQLTPVERRAHLRSVADGAGPALGLAGLAGSLAEILDGATMAADLGYRAVMLHEPLDPLTDSVGIHAFWDAVLDRIDLPAVLYTRSGRVSGSALRALADRPEVAGIKYAAADVGLLGRLADGDDGCVWINGSAEARVPATAELGIRGFTSGLANIRPDLALAVHRAAAVGDSEVLDWLLGSVGPFERLRNVDGGRRNVAVVKQGLRWSGFDVGDVRPPAMAADPAEVAAIMRALPSPEQVAVRVAGL
ncbi:dihydrodipicolinate synthase family protein [Nakamurella sp. YIM 132087]|uniref:Dihydrodipicolinate synthase family protein n=1 Tax=Nakamurella alba TaxID=2665158 RepID=A0A7K1FSQ4_9ACTN|nr:dihydrodipicolinate synthase family protein [Nakamurella alba]MTD17185.1 dihydrodipicolinate synthase family protein [Nakamurella alba]